MSIATPAPLAGPSISVGELLRSWRRRRRLSQLDLALEATVSARHVSFLETGRARPSREMLLHLAEHLEVPLAPVRQALDRFLRAHEPYPALVVDRHHNLLAANDAVATLTEGVAPELLEPPANALRIALHPQGMAPRTVNLAEWSAHLLERLRREARITGDAALGTLHEELASHPGVEPALSHEGAAPAAEIVVPLRLRDEAGAELAFFSTIATFGTAIDITLAEVAVEAFYPANARTAMRLLGDVGATG